MFDDPKEELKRLEQKLLAEEEKQMPSQGEEDWFEKELREAKALIGDSGELNTTRVFKTPVASAAKPQQVPDQVRNYVNNYGKTIRNTDKVDLNMNKFSDEVMEESKDKGVKVLLIFTILETLGIVGLVAYWLLFLL